uniref:Uncharacterized protein n=1 Tax=Bionectria ochroleuca TaxID=29856 RepID=A0A0B7K3Z1_BIOOC
MVRFFARCSRATFYVPDP